MSDQSLQVQIKSLEVQLSVLKAQMVAEADVVPPNQRFADLFGILAGKSNSTDDDIRSVEYHAPLEPKP